MRIWIRRHRTAAAMGLLGISAGLLVVALLFNVFLGGVRTETPAAADPESLTVTLKSDDTLKITYLGDSLAAGLFATTEQDSYRGIVTRTLAAGGPVEESGTRIVGGTVAETMEGNEQFPPDQHVYIVELGTNDINDVDYRTFRQQYADMLTRVRQVSPQAALVCLGTWRPEDRGGEYDLMIRGVCEAHNGKYRPLSDLESNPDFKGPAGRQTFSGSSDTFHPNNAGHRAIADRVLTMVTVDRER